MAIKKEKKEDTQHVGLRMPTKLVKKIDDIFYYNKTDRSTEIIRACEEYVAKYFPEDSEYISEPSVDRAIVADEVMQFFRTDEGQALVKKFVNEKILKKEDSE